MKAALFSELDPDVGIEHLDDLKYPDGDALCHFCEKECSQSIHDEARLKIVSGGKSNKINRNWKLSTLISKSAFPLRDHASSKNEIPQMLQKLIYLSAHRQPFVKLKTKCGICRLDPNARWKFRWITLAVHEPAKSDVSMWSRFIGILRLWTCIDLFISVSQEDSHVSFQQQLEQLDNMSKLPIQTPNDDDDVLPEGQFPPASAFTRRKALVSTTLRTDAQRQQLSL